MALSDHRSDDPALDRYGPKPTDRDLPLERRTSASPYILGVAVALLIGLALIIFGIVRFSQSTADLDQSGSAVAPFEQLAPPSNDQDSPVDTPAAPGSEAGPDTVPAQPGDIDVPGSD